MIMNEGTVVGKLLVALLSINPVCAVDSEWTFTLSPYEDHYPFFEEVEDTQGNTILQP